jgi:hypothetical protein
MWHFRKVLHKPDKPPSKGQVKGTEGHKRLAHYLTTGQDVLSDLERLGVERGLVPLPDTSSQLVEHKFTALDADGVPLLGYIDLVDYAGVYPRVTDWKFKKSIDKWGATKESLIDPHHSDGIQMLGYAEWIRRQGFKLDVVLRHVTFQTEGKRDVVEAAVTISLDIVREHWLEVSKAIAPMKAAAKESDPFKVEPNFKACDKYGGCAYRSICLAPLARLTAGFKKEHEMSLLKKLAGTVAPSTPAPSAPSATAPPASGPIIPSASTTAPVPAQAVIAPGGPRSVVIDVAPGETEQQARERFIREQQAKPAAVLPPDAPSSNPAAFSVPAGTPAVNPAPGGTAGAGTVSSPVVPAVTPTPATPSPSPAQGVTADAPKPRRGRPPKSAAQRAVEAAIPTPSSVPQAAIPDASGSLDGVFLYRGCAPVGIETAELTAYTQALEKACLAAIQVNAFDIRTSNHEGLKFNKWKAYLAAAVKEEPPAPGHYVVVSGDERVQVVADAVMALLPAGNVILGGR